MEVDLDMKRLWALWLALPTTALNYWLFWSRLPAKIAMHYDASGRPNSWASPEEARTFVLGFLTVMLVILTAIGYLVAYARPDRARSAVILLYIVVGLLWMLLNGFVWFNLVG